MPETVANDGLRAATGAIVSASGMRVVPAASQQRFLGAAVGARRPTHGVPLLQYPLHAVTDEPAAFVKHGDNPVIVVPFGRPSAVV